MGSSPSRSAAFIMSRRRARCGQGVDPAHEAETPDEISIHVDARAIGGIARLGKITAMPQPLKPVLGYRAIAEVLRCTIPASALRALAQALGSSQLDTASKMLNGEGRIVEFRTGSATTIGFDYQRTPAFVITMTAGDLSVFAARLAKLAGQPDRSAFSLAELDFASIANFDCDFEFYKQGDIPVLRNDYRPHGAGGTWEANLYHPVPSPTGLRCARDAFIAWCAPSPEPGVPEVMIQTDEGEEWLAPDQAFERFCATQQHDGQLCLFGEHSLVLPYGNPFSDIKVWVFEDSTLFIVSEHCVVTGDFRADIENYFRYRRIVRSFAAALDAETVAWGDGAESWPPELVKPVSALDDREILWRWFVDILAECSPALVLPGWIESRFDEMFAHETR